MFNPLLVLRLISELPGADADAAEAEAREAEARLLPVLAVTQRKVARYRKFADAWEITLHLSPADSGTFDAVLALARAGWEGGDLPTEEFGEDRWAVWNPAAGAELLTPRVRWAHLDLFEAGAILPEAGGYVPR